MLPSFSCRDPISHAHPVRDGPRNRGEEAFSTRDKGDVLVKQLSFPFYIFIFTVAKATEGRSFFLFYGGGDFRRASEYTRARVVPPFILEVVLR